MRNKIKLFLIIFVILVLFLGVVKVYKKRLIEYFVWKIHVIDVECFNSLLKNEAETNLIARPEFLLDKEGNFKCVDIGFFLKKFNVEIDKVEPITFYGCGPYLKIIGCKVSGKWYGEKEKKYLTVYFYYCDSIPLKNMEKEEKYYEERPNKLLSNKTHAIEVIGDNDYYEIFGKFKWLEGKRPFHAYLRIYREIGASYELESSITHKKLLLLNKEGKDKKRICTTFDKKMVSFYDSIINLLEYF